jgi:hypothetical protein
MWTPEHRAAARRQALRYASDLTDEEWALVAPMIPPARHGGRPRDVNIRQVLTAFFTCCRPAANRRRRPRICRRKARCGIISSCGIGTARWSASIASSIGIAPEKSGIDRSRLSARLGGEQLLGQLRKDGITGDACQQGPILSRPFAVTRPNSAA